MGRLYLLRVWLCVMLVLVSASELCSQSLFETLLHICFLQSTERTFYFNIIFEFTLLRTVFNIKILTESVVGFYTSPVLATYFLCYKIELHNLFEHNTD